MSDRRNRIRAKNRTMAYIAAGVVHAVLIAGMVINFTSSPKVIEGAYAEKVDVVKATTVDESQLKKRADKLKADEVKRKKKLADEAKLKKKKADDAKKKKAAAEAEIKRKKAIDLKKKEEEAKKKKEDARKKKEKQEREKKEKLERDKQKQKEDAERIKREQLEAQRQQELQDSIAAEEAFLADQIAQQRTTTLIAKYSALIQQKVDGVRTIAPDFEQWRVAVVNIKLSPLGEVISTRIVKSSGSDRYDRSVESAILKSSPLPIPSQAEDASANRTFRDINYEFPMPGA